MKLTLKIIAACLCAVILAACGAAANPNPIPPVVIDPTTQPPGFSINDTVAGTGAVAANGDIVSVTYTGWVYSTTAANSEGALFVSNVSTQPLSFVLGTGQAILVGTPSVSSGQSIPGFEQGVVGMAAGGTRTIVVPSSLGYGPVAQTDSVTKLVTVPANSGLIFNVQLLSVTKAQ
ncbi:MAG TPA: FKBP-type peptidyl-prolyl cis-trans isomerase [Janthinobacterium sp.]|jgi:FKBP-type peptidyl-prolyl cis-trans isomerase|nr:FKBP-type peptidyl-prolyl cis-trans isomerase [Janthinobacterium sp.]